MMGAVRRLSFCVSVKGRGFSQSAPRDHNRISYLTMRPLRFLISNPRYKQIDGIMAAIKHGMSASFVL